MAGGAGVSGRRRGGGRGRVRRRRNRGGGGGAAGGGGRAVARAPGRPEAVAGAVARAPGPPEDAAVRPARRAGAVAAAAPVAPSHAADAAFCAQQLMHGGVGLHALPHDVHELRRSIPRSAKSGTVSYVGASDWTSGFPAGSFWLLYERTRDQAWRTAAETWTAALMSQRTRTDTHDVGFVIYNSFGNGYRLTQNAAYRTVVLTAAASLASRFDADVGCTRSWDFGTWSFPVIIDNMMNLELLFRATALGGDARFAQIGHDARADHAHESFPRRRQLVPRRRLQPDDRRGHQKQTNQGLADESAWARGQAWGLYGFTMSYRETNDARFLDQATRIAEFYTKSPLMPADGVPYFDFDAPVRDDVPDYRDASAGAIAASGLFELAKYATGAAAESYRAFAIKAVRSLSSTAYRAATGTNSQFLLMHSVGNYPQNDEIDVAHQLRRLLLSGGARALRDLP